MAETTYRTPWGSLRTSDIARFSTLGLAFMFIITNYWTLRSLKDPIFSQLVGIEFQPTAKMISMLVFFPLLVGYSKLVDMVRKDRLFLLFITSYSLLFLTCAYLLNRPDIGLAVSSPNPYNILGWFIFILIESFGSIMVALFWAFTTSEYTAEEGKQGFPLIIFLSQLGAIIGPTVVTFASVIGIASILAGSGVMILFIPITISIYKAKFGLRSLKTEKKPKKPSHAFAGLKIIIQDPYVLGIMGIATLHEIINTIVDFQMKYLAFQEYRTPEEFAVFMGQYGQIVNISCLLVAFLGSSFLLRRLGLRFCLLIYPVVLGILVSIIYFTPSLPMLVTFMVLYKTMNYSINNPSKEILYIPTSEDTRYKAKAWIDAFGARSCKAIGAGVTHSLKSSFTLLISRGSLVCLGVIGLWVMIALFVSTRFSQFQQQPRKG